MGRSLGRLVPVSWQRVEERRPRQFHDVLQVALARRPFESPVVVGRSRRPRDGPRELRELAQVVHHGAASLERLLRIPEERPKGRKVIWLKISPREALGLGCYMALNINFGLFSISL